MTRWRIPFAGFLLALMGGISYAWGVFVLPMMNRFSWTKIEATLPFTVFMIVFSLVMVPGGILQDKFGPKIVSFIGSFLFLLSYSLAALIGIFSSILWLIFSYSLIGGIACGLTYACVAPPVRKWFPDKPGVAISFSVMGFGLAALFFAPLKASYLIPVFGIEKTFIVIAIVTSLFSFLAALIISNPPEGWNPDGWSPLKAKKTIRIRQESTPKEILKNKLFWSIWVTFALVIAGGLIALGLIPAYGQRKIGLDAIHAAFAISIFSGVNGFGRPIAGLLGDKFGIVHVLITTFIVQAIIFILFPIFATTIPILYIFSGILGWGYAVILALFPSLTSLCFGIKNFGINYGLVFTAFGVGAIAPLAGALIFDLTNSYTLIFISAGIMALIGLFMCIRIKISNNLP